MPSLNYPFLQEWDDYGFVFNGHMELNAANIHYWLTHNTQGVFTPAAMFSLMFDYTIAGAQPLQFRLHNLLLHITTVIVFFLLLRHFRLPGAAAFWIALFYAVHPQRLESVVWITERKDVLFGCCSFLSMLFFAKAYDRGKFSCAALILMTIAVLAKPPGLAVVPAMCLYAFHRRRSLNLSLYPWWMGIYACSGIALFWWIKNMSISGIIDPLPRTALVVLHNFSWYIRTTFFPDDPNPIYPNVYATPDTLMLIAATFAAIAAIIIIPLRQLKEKREFMIYDLLPFITAYCFAVLPTIKFFRFNEADYCDRYNYMASAYLLMAAGLIAHSLWKNSDTGEMSDASRKKLLLCGQMAAAAYALFLAGLTVIHLPEWQNTHRLFESAIAVNKPNHRALMALGEVGLNRNDPELMLKSGNLLIEYAQDCREYQLPAYLKYPWVSENTGKALCAIAMAQKKDYQNAIPALLELSRLHQEQRLTLFYHDIIFKKIYTSLAECYLGAGQEKKAVNALENAISATKPGSAENYMLLGLIKFYSNDYRSAATFFAQAQILAPEDAAIRSNLNKALQLQK